MQLNTTPLTGLLGAIIISAGLSSSLAAAKDSTDTSPKPAAAEPTNASESQESEAPVGMVEVRISMPDGRTIVQYEPKRASSARYTRTVPTRVTRTLPDGSRISYAQRGSSASGGSSSSSGAHGSASQSNSGGSGGAGMSASGGGSSGGASSGKSGGSSGGGGGSGSGGGGGSGGAGLTPLSAASGTDMGSVGVGHRAPHRVHTVGDAVHEDDGAVGGQTVEFAETGMGGQVMGNSVYLTGVQLVQSSGSFDTVEGTSIGGDLVMMSSMLPASSPLGGGVADPGSIILDFESGSVVDLVMFSKPADNSNPIRERRTWSVRIR
tara:strand:+ start:182662 stop:183627 length:966 start_codon:yes stop_codon:yes gene_type:complete